MSTHRAMAALTTTLQQFGAPRHFADNYLQDDTRTVTKPRLSAALKQRLEDVHLEALEHLFISRNIWSLQQVYTLEDMDRLWIISKATTILNAHGFLGLHDLKDRLTALLNERAYLQTFTLEVASSTKHDTSQSTPSPASAEQDATVTGQIHEHRPHIPGMVPLNNTQVQTGLPVPAPLQPEPTALQRQQAGFAELAVQPRTANFDSPLYNLPDPPAQDCTWCLKRLKSHLHFH